MPAVGASVLARDENGQKRSAKGFTIFTFTFFHQKRKRYDIIGNENDIGNAVISETKIYGREHIDNDRETHQNDKHIKQ